MARQCVLHPDVSDSLFYCYPFPPDVAVAFEGMLLCPECQEHFKAQDWAYFKEEKSEDTRSKARERGFHRS